MTDDIEVTFEQLAADASTTLQQLTKKADEKKAALETAKKAIEEESARLAAEKLAIDEARVTKEFFASVQLKVYSIKSLDDKPELVIDRRLPAKPFNDFMTNNTLRRMFTIKFECTRKDCRRLFAYDGISEKRRRCDDCYRRCNVCDGSHVDYWYDTCQSCSGRPQ